MKGLVSSMGISSLKSQVKVRKRVRRAIEEGLNSWYHLRGKPVSTTRRRSSKATGGIGTGGRTQDEVLSSIPRRAITTTPISDVSLPAVQSVAFKTSRVKAIGRMFIWLYMIFYFVSGNLWDRIRRRDSETRRAIRLRLAFEKAGGTLIKFGQQMSMRIDLLPWAYTAELAKMLDRVPPFPLEQAIEIIERTTGKAWQDIFAVFDPEPIGSASIANVYQAILKNGDKVAVKVRRPGIGELFMADFRVFDWLLDSAEFLTIFRPGYTHNIRREFKTTLLEELDFIQEARFQDMFRRNAKKSRKRFFTAPRIYFEFSNPEVIVQGYTEGIWLWEVMAGVEQRNTQALARMRELKVDPKKVAERLLWVNYWGMQEKLTLIDFGSCGSFNREQRAGLELIAIASGQNDAEGMARGAMKLFEPLPPVDLKSLFQDAEAEYTRVLAIHNSPQEYTAWWELTSVRQWMSFFKFSRDNNIPVTIHTLRMVRATLLYDTAAVRIFKDVDRFKQYIKFKKYREEQAKRRVLKRFGKQLRFGDDSFFLWLEEFAKSGEKLMFRTQNMLGSPAFNFGSLVGKWFFATSTAIKLIGRLSLFTLLVALIVVGVQVAGGIPFTTTDILMNVFSNRVYQLIVVIILITNTRHILFRLSDQEI
jgi:predicted unusual protein kinase regulating ubiquinone biosynthesis (AarF/ABC1/UbiB family)